VPALDIDPETWAALNRLLDAALDLPASERERWLEALPPEHEALKPRLRALLAHASKEQGAALFDTVPKLEVGASEVVQERAGDSTPEAPDPKVPPGSGPKLGRYELRGLLGVGGMGRVYRAFDSVLGREVAIKTLARAFRDEASRLRVEREARLLATLNHPNVAAIYGFELSAGIPCLILELVEGETLAERLERDGTIVLAPSPRSGLVRVAATGGAPTPLTQLDHAQGEGSHRWPQVLPRGRWVLFTVGIHDATADDARLEAVSLDTRERRRLLSNGSYGRYTAGRLFFVGAGRLFAVPFDLETLTLGGTPEVVLEGVHYDLRTGGAHVALSDGGTLVYGPAPPTSLETYVAWVDAAGNLTRIGDAPRQFREPRLSPDGRRVAARIGTEAESDLWTVETGSGMLARLSFGLSPHRPVWTADGRGITVAAEIGAAGSSSRSRLREGLRARRSGKDPTACTRTPDLRMAAP
jgi:hypothetical protein